MDLVSSREISRLSLPVSEPGISERVKGRSHQGHSLQLLTTNKKNALIDDNVYNRNITTATCAMISLGSLSECFLNDTRLTGNHKPWNFRH